MDYFMVLSIIFAFIVKGLCGFANTLVFTTMMSFRTSNINITPVELLVGYPSNIILAWNSRHTLSIKVWLPLASLVIAGSIPSTFLLKNGDVTLIKIIFGFAVVLIGLEMFLREYQKKKQQSSTLLLGFIGILSGFLCGLFGIGALLAAYVSRTTDNTQAFRGNLSLVFLVENTFRILLYSFTGIITLHTLRTALSLLPFMLLGLMTGILLSKVLDEKFVKKLVILMLILSGISLILNNLFS